MTFVINCLSSKSRHFKLFSRFLRQKDINSQKRRTFYSRMKPVYEQTSHEATNHFYFGCFHSNPHPQSNVFEFVALDYRLLINFFD